MIIHWTFSLNVLNESLFQIQVQYTCWATSKKPCDWPLDFSWSKRPTSAPVSVWSVNKAVTFSLHNYDHRYPPSLHSRMSERLPVLSATFPFIKDRAQVGGPTRSDAAFAS